MGEDKTSKQVDNGHRTGNIEEILRERDRLERILRERFEKQVVILFTDICGYTEHTDLHGDVSGLTLIQRHNQIVLPIIKKHKGVVIKTIGDAVMASFSNSLNAVKASVAIQNALYKYNRTVEVSDQIHIKLGINIGQALVDQVDIHGDVVNVASRIQAQAGPDQILISSNVYEQVRGIEDILCRSQGTVQVKGKAEPLELYRVIWRDEDIILSTEPKVRAYGGVPQRGVPQGGVPQGESRKRVIKLEVARQDTKLKIMAHERMSCEESTLRNYEEIPVSMNWIQTRCHEMVESLNAVNRQGRFSREVLVKLRETGWIFYNELLPPAVKAKLKETDAEYLSLNIDDHLVQVPWELLYDGQQFLCQRFNMGRLVKTRQPVQGKKTRVLARPLKMLIIADPAGDLKDAYKEGLQIKEHLAQYDHFINVFLRSQDITPSFIKEKMKYFDLVHFAGHADYDQNNLTKTGWRLTQGSLTAQDVVKMAGSATMPALIFSNSCQSARTGDWATHYVGLAHAFLLSGVRHYVGTFWEILDEPGSYFALEFYKRLLSGATTGEAVREARVSLIKKYGEQTAAWASYLLYGDPTSNYLDQIKMAETAKEPSVSTHIEGTKPAGASHKLRWWLLLSGLGLLFLAIAKSSFHQEKSTALFFPQGNILSTNQTTDFQKTIQIIHLLSEYQQASRFKKKGFFINSPKPDAWSSAPLSIGMILPDWENTDISENFRPQFEMLFKKMIESFSQTHTLGLSILERQRLEAILQELQIGISDLSTTTLKDAQAILSAQVILFPEPVQFKQERQVSLRLVETKSTKIIAAFSRPFSSHSINKAARELVKKTMQTLEKHYPLQGRIVSGNRESVEINLGTIVGLSRGQVFRVLGQTENKPPKGIIRVQSVYEHTSVAKISQQNQEFKPGDRIKAIVDNQGAFQ